jgi:hypothetical protein
MIMENEDWKTIPGCPYDWTITKKPERPYIHDYTRALTGKLFLASPRKDQSVSIVNLTFAEALEVIRQIDAMTFGVHKILYLVGWQYLGHDSKYPAWHEVNQALKRPEDKTALDSLLWLFAEAEKYHTTVSLHINMRNAYQNSPLWQAYLDAGVIAMDEKGDPIKDNMWVGGQGFIINCRREWESGLAKKRIDELCAMLPIQKAGTIHIDAMVADADPGHGEALKQVQEGRRQIIRYWRGLGVDVTLGIIYNEGDSSGTRNDQLIGLSPFVFEIAQTLPEYIARPGSLICGAFAANWYKTVDTGDYAELFGYNGNVEWIVVEHTKDWQSLLFNDFMKKNIKFFYLNTLERQQALVESDRIRVQFSDKVETSLRLSLNGFVDPRTTRRGEVMQEGTDFLFPSPWYKAGTAIAYSAKGGKFEYDLSAIMDWGADKEVCIQPVTRSGLSNKKTKSILHGGKLELKLNAGNAVLIALASV